MKVSGPLVVAENMSGTKMYEAQENHVRTMTTLLTGSKTSFACSVAQESPNVAQFCKVWSVWSRKHSSL